MHHQHGQLSLVNHVAGEAAEHRLPPAAVRIGAHHQKVRLFFSDLFIESRIDALVIRHFDLRSRCVDAMEAQIGGYLVSIDERRVGFAHADDIYILCFFKKLQRCADSPRRFLGAIPCDDDFFRRGDKARRRT